MARSIGEQMDEISDCWSEIHMGWLVDSRVHEGIITILDMGGWRIYIIFFFL